MGLYANALVESGRFGASDQVVVLDGKAVLDVSAQAVERGISLGMKEKEARLIAPGAIYVERVKEEFEHASNRWLDICAEFSDSIEPIDQHAAYIDLTAHPDPIEAASLLIETIELRSGLKCCWGIGPNKWLAALEMRTEPCFDTINFVQSLSVRKLPVPIDCILSLERLGCSKVKDVAQIDGSTLRRHFGSLGSIIYNASRGKHFQPILSLYPSDTAFATLRFDGKVDNGEVMLAALRVLAKKLAKKLAIQDSFGRELHLTIETESIGKIEIQKKFSKPLACTNSVLAALNSIAKDNLPEEAIMFRAAIPNLKRRPANQMQFEPQGSSKRNRCLDLTMSQVRSKFGEGSIRSASQLPVPRYIRFLREWKYER